MARGDRMGGMQPSLTRASFRRPTGFVAKAMFNRGRLIGPHQDGWITARMTIFACIAHLLHTLRWRVSFNFKGLTHLAQVAQRFNVQQNAFFVVFPVFHG
jgi:hypothetical protein